MKRKENMFLGKKIFAKIFLSPRVRRETYSK